MREVSEKSSRYISRADLKKKKKNFAFRSFGNLVQINDEESIRTSPSQMNEIRLPFSQNKISQIRAKSNDFFHILNAKAKGRLKVSSSNKNKELIRPTSLGKILYHEKSKPICKINLFDPFENLSSKLQPKLSKIKLRKLPEYKKHIHFESKKTLSTEILKPKKVVLDFTILNCK